MLVHECLRDQGFDYQAGDDPLQQPMKWRRPRYITDTVFMGEPLQPYVERYSGLPTPPGMVGPPVDAFVDVYERFIAGYICSRKDHGTRPVAWLASELQMTETAAYHIFSCPKSQSGRFNSHVNLLQFAAMVYHSIPCKVQQSADTFVVRSLEKNYRFGIYEGRLTSNSGQMPVRVRHLVSPTGYLQDVACHSITKYSSYCKVPYEVLDYARRWAELREGTESEVPGLIEALEILRWTVRGGFASVRKLLSPVSSPAVIQGYLDRAATFREYADPFEMLRETLVPVVFNVNEFHRRFGYLKPGKLGSYQLKHSARWDAEIRELADQNKNNNGGFK